MAAVKFWTLYILRCSDDTLYTGITNNLKKRFECHQSGKGARYTRGRLPVKIVYSESCSDKGDALSREHAVKSLSRTEKTKLISKVKSREKCKKAGF
jgi:putative endonuclease